MSDPVKINDGGPAFPLPPVGTGDPRDGMAGGSVGMSLRAYFAGQVLPEAIRTMLSIDKDKLDQAARKLGVPVPNEGPPVAAAFAVEMADALIAELEKGKL